MANATARHWAEALEPRLLHSADLSPLLAGGALLPLQQHESRLDSATTDAATAAASEIVFVDASLPDVGTLLADLQSQQAAGRPLEVVLLNGSDDALSVIGSTLAGRSGVTAVHLLGHGADGQLQLGATRLDGQTVLQRADELSAWRSALAPDADLLIYGCNVAAGDAGLALVADLAALTGADVAASDDLTGAAATGGDWVLEVRSGDIEAALAPGTAALQAYAGTLAVETTEINSKKSAGIESSITWHHDTASGDDRLLVVQLVVASQASTTAVSYQGQALTLLARQDSSSVLGALRTEVWYLLAPTVGHGDVSVTSSFDVGLIGGSVSFNNVDQASPFGPVAQTANHNSNVSLLVTAAAGDIVVDVLGSKGVESGSYGGGQSELWDESQGDSSGDLWGSASRESGAASVTMSQELDHDSGGERWVYIAVAVKAANTAPVISSNGGGASAALTVAENATAVTTVVASDAESSPLSYAINGGADAARFTIDATSGALRFAGAPNAETPADADGDNVYQVTVSASDGTLSDQQALTVTVSDVNEFALGAIADTNAVADQVAEGAAIGSSVGITARATDADAGTNTVGYSLTDSAGGRFSIDAATGVVRVAAALDREAAASHSITVRAASSDGSSRTRSFSIAVADIDEFDTGAVTDADAAVNAVRENAGIGSVVGITAGATDGDATLDTITYSFDDSAGGRFAIDAATGVLRVAGALDHESASSHAVVVRATSADGSASTAVFTIAVLDDDEAGVGVVADLDGSANSVAENGAPGAATGLTARASDPDGTDVVTYSLLDNAGGRFVIDAASGVVRSAVALDAEAGAQWDVVVRATSTDGTHTSQTFTIGIVDSDEFDVSAPADADGAVDAVEENAAIGSTVGVRAGAVDADAGNNTVSYSLLDDAGGRFAIDAASGRITVAAALDREAAASHGVTVQALSADGSSAQTRFTIAVVDVNEFFVAAVVDADATANTVGETAAAGTAVGLVASAVDADAGSNTITYSLLDDAGGRFAIDAASGVVRVAGALDFENASSHRITVRAASADGSGASSDFTIAVGASNDNTPAFVSGSAASVGENTTAVATVVAGDADLPAPDLVYTIGGGADAALFLIDAATGVLRFAAAPDFEQPLDADRDNRYQVDVTASDGQRSASQSLQVTVTDVDELPLLSSHAAAAGVSLGVIEGNTAVTTVVAVDPEGTLPVYRIAGGADAALFAVDAATGVLRWLAAPDFEDARDAGADNVYDVSVAASDGANDTLQTFSIVVGNRNEAPVAAVALADLAIVEDLPFTLVLPAAAFDDVDAAHDPQESLTWSANLASGAALPAWLSFDAATRSFGGTPGNGDVGSLTLRVQVSDAAGAAAWQDFVLTVANTNDAPLAGTPVVAPAATEDSALHFTLPALVFSDIDAGDTLSLSASQVSGAPLPSWLHFDAASRSFSGTPGNAEVGSLALRVHASDAAGAAAFTDFVLVVANANDAPAAASPLADQTVDEDAAFSLALPGGAFADVDAGETLVWRVAQVSGEPLPAWLRFDADSRSFSGTPGNGDVGSLTLRVQVTDTAGAAAWQDFVLTVANANDVPLAGAPVPAPAATEDSALHFTLPALVFSDIDAGDTLSLSASQVSGAPLPSWLRFDAASRSFSGTPGNAEVGSLALRVHASDAAGAAAFTDFVLVVANVNDAPTAASPLADKTVDEDAAFSLALPGGAFADVDAGETLTWRVTQVSGEALPSWLRFDADSRSFSGTPGNADVGSLTLRVQVSDAAGAAAWQDFVLTVANANDAPVAGPAAAPQTAFEGTPFSFALPATALVDPDHGDGLQFSAQLASGQPLPAWLQFDAARQRFSGTPGMSDRATLEVRVTATDRSGAQAQTELVIVVQASPMQILAAVETPPPPPPPAAAPAAEPEPEPEAEPEPAAKDASAAPAGAATHAAAEILPDLLPPTPRPVEAAAAADTEATATMAVVEPYRGSGASASDAMLAPAVLPQFAGLSGGSQTAGAWLHASDMQRNHEVLQQMQQQASAQRRAAMASGVAISGGLSIGYVVWLVRGGVLMSSMMSTLPAWKMLDPLPVLAAAVATKRRGRGKDNNDADDFERLFDEGEPAPKPAPKPKPKTKPVTPDGRAPDDTIPEEIER